jgi:hypothetical protein
VKRGVLEREKGNRRKTTAAKREKRRREAMRTSLRDRSDQHDKETSRWLTDTLRATPTRRGEGGGRGGGRGCGTITHTHKHANCFFWKTESERPNGISEKKKEYFMYCQLKHKATKKKEKEREGKGKGKGVCGSREHVQLVLNTLEILIKAEEFVVRELTEEGLLLVALVRQTELEDGSGRLDSRERRLRWRPWEKKNRTWGKNGKGDDARREWEGGEREMALTCPVCKWSCQWTSSNFRGTILWQSKGGERK